MYFKKEYTTIYLIIAFLILVIILFAFFQTEFNSEIIITLLWGVLLVILITFGNRFISSFLNKRLPWNKYLSVRFFVQLISVLFYSLLCFNISYYVFKLMFTNDPPSPDQVAMVNIYGSLIVLPIFSIYYVVYFINEWKKIQIKSEKLEKESVKTQLENLKNHLDPHFLFNNLNILSSLIDIDKESSKKYLTKFAEVYRFMLQTKATELIALKKEMEFIDAYFQLIATRYQDALYLKKNISNEKYELQLPPMTLQLLIENAIKHNSFSKSDPLIVEIMEEGDHKLRVRNNLKRHVMPISTTGSGLKNIRDRFKFFTDTPVQISDTGKYFEVIIPLIEIEEA